MAKMQAPLLMALGLLLAGLNQVNSFSWENCDEEQDPVVLKSLVLEPDPITFPGRAAISTRVQINDPLRSPQKLELTIQKKVLFFWITIPCMNNIGSCTYEDLCQILDTLIPPGNTCPGNFHSYGLPCRCPINSGIYTLPKTMFTLPHIPLPSWLTAGNYYIKAVLSSEGKRLGCIKITAALKS